MHRRPWNLSCLSAFHGKARGAHSPRLGARRRTKAEHLRDEMREHLRLKEIGVLPAEEYETAKVRILDQHSPAAQPSLARASTSL